MKIKRVISLLVLIAFLSTQNNQIPVYAISTQPVRPSAQLPEKVDEVTVPQKLGTLQETYQGKSGEKVIIIQDAHAIPEAQKSIQHLIGYFQKKYGVNTIALEGAGSRLDPQIFRSFPDKKKLAQVFKEYQKKGELTGTAAAAIFNAQAADYYGVEDWPLYDEGFNLFLESMESEAALTQKIKTRGEALQKEKEKKYSKELLRADQALQDFYANQIDFAQALKNLAALKAPEKNSSLAAVLELSIDSNALNPEQETVLKEISEKIEKNLAKIKVPAKTIKQFHQSRQDFATSRSSSAQYAHELKQVIQAFPDALFTVENKALQEISRSYQKIQNLEGSAFFKEFEAYAASVKESLFENDAQRDLDNETRELVLVQKLVKLELSTEEWEEYSEKRTAYSVKRIVLHSWVRRSYKVRKLSM